MSCAAVRESATGVQPCANVLRWLKDCDTAFDVLILDEARSLCDKFAIQTTVGHPGCFEQLRLHYTRATYVIAADADCGVDNAER